MKPTPPVRWRDWGILCLILALGLGLRLPGGSSNRAPLGDEKLYVAYLEWTKQHGFFSYPDLVESFLEGQREAKEPALPPTRIVFVGAGRIVQAVTGWPGIDALRFVARLCSILLLLAVWWLAFLLRGPLLAHLSLLLLAVSPLQLHSANFAFVDVVFALGTTGGLIALALVQTGRIQLAAVGWALTIPILILTKESAVFALAALGAVMIWLGRSLDSAGRRLLLFSSLLGAIMTALVVGILFGGSGNFLTGVLMLGAKTKGSQYSATYQNGPWFRYVLDYLIVSPVILLGFVACVGRVWREWSPAGRMLLFFLGATLLPMSLLEAGINLRFALMWDPVVRVILAAGLALSFGEAPAGQRRAVLCVVLLAAAELGHYVAYFASGQLYDPVTLALLRLVGLYRGDYLYAPAP